MNILVGAAVPPIRNCGATGTVWQTNRALERMGHRVKEIWDDELGRTIQHGNLFYACELPARYRRAVSREVRRGDFDVVELNQPHAFLAFEWMARHSKVLRVNRSHGVEPHADDVLDAARIEPRSGMRARSVLRSACSRLLRKRLRHHWWRTVHSSDGVIVSSSVDADYLRTRLGADRVRVETVPQGVAHQFLRNVPPPMSRDRLLRMIYAGNLNPLKGSDLLIAVVERVLRRNRLVSFTCICPMEDHEWFRSSFHEDLRSRVSLISWLSQEHLQMMFDRHGILVFPSRFEGFGKVPLEAMARGMCVVSSRVGGMRDYVRNGEDGLLIPSGRVEEFVSAIQWLQCNPEKAATISRNAVRVASRFHWDRTALDVTRFYERLSGLPAVS